MILSGPIYHPRESLRPWLHPKCQRLLSTLGYPTLLELCDLLTQPFSERAALRPYFQTTLLESVTARIKRDHWVQGLPRHRWYTVRSYSGLY